jgi:hypothetical protein
MGAFLSNVTQDCALRGKQSLKTLCKNAQPLRMSFFSARCMRINLNIGDNPATQFRPFQAIASAAATPYSPDKSI